MKHVSLCKSIYVWPQALLALGLALFLTVAALPSSAQTPTPLDMSTWDIVSLQQKAAAGDAVSQAELASRYLFAKEAPLDYALGLAWARKAADQGNARGQYLVGLCNDNAWATGYAPKEALHWWQLSADQGYAEAEYALGSYWLRDSKNYSTGGIGTTAIVYASAPYMAVWFRAKESKDIKRGEKLLQASADQGYAPAEVSLGEMARHRQHNFEATTWFKKAADQGELKAYLALGDIYYDGGKDLPKDPTQSAEWYRKAADKNSAEAQEKLGNLYRDGIGVSKDSAEAIVWYDKAAADNRKWAEQMSAINIERCKFHYARLADILTKEAQLGDSAADKELGDLYKQGLGVQLDKQQAANWYAKAVVDGNADAQKDLVAVKQEIADDQAAAAQAQAEQQAKNKKSDRASWIALAGLGTAGIANAYGANAATALQAGTSAAALTAKLTSDNDGNDAATALLSGAAQGVSGQTSTPILDTANQQAAAIRAIGDANSAKQQAAVQPAGAMPRRQATLVSSAQPATTAQPLLTSSRTPVASSGAGTVVSGSFATTTTGPMSVASGSGPASVGQNLVSGHSEPPATAACTDATKFISYRVKVASDGFVVGWLTNNSNQVLYVSYTFARGGKPYGPETGATTLHPGETQGGELGGIWAPGSDVDTKPPAIYWSAVLQSDIDQGKNCPKAW